MTPLLSGRTAPIRTYAVIALVLAVMCGTMLFSVFLINTMSELASSLAVQARDIKTEATLAHLWAEEFIDGDPDIRPDDVERHFAAADRALQELSGRLASARRNIFLSRLGDVEPLVTSVKKDLAATRDIARTRMASPAVSRSGSVSDQQNDAAFTALLKNASLLEQRLFEVTSAQRGMFQTTQLSLIALSICFALGAVLVVRRYDRKRIADYELISAQNQQLQATEQQLRATNQQLMANEQQLRASNQQLMANEQQLRASNQQLRANERALVESESRYRTLFSNMSEGVALHQIVYDAAGRAVNYAITDINAQYVNILGITRDQSVGRLATDVYGTAEPPYLEEFARVADTGIPCRFETYFPPLNRHFSISASSYETGSFATVFADITEQKKAVELLQKDEERLESLLEISQYQGTSMEALYDLALARALSLTASRFGCLFLSDAASGRLELGSSSCSGGSGCSRNGAQTECVMEDRGILRDILLQKSPLIMNTIPAEWYPDTGAEQKPFSRCMAIPVTIDDRLVAVVAVADRETPYETTDVRQLTLMMDTVMRIAERRKTEEETGRLATRIQKLESLGVLAGGIAHDFNNLLTAVLANIGLASFGAQENHEVVKRLAEAEKAVLRARDLTQQLLTFSKGGAPVKKISDVSAVIQDACLFAIRGSRSRCEFDFATDLWHAEVDPGQIGQAVNNIVMNSVQAMPSGGVISITAGNYRVQDGSAFPLQPGRYVRVTIRDNGIGIPAEYLQKIFDPYFTTKQKGSGLGLAVTHSIILNHSGAITVESTPGSGTSFDIFLPAAVGTAEPERASSSSIPRGTGRILIMDDEEAVRKTTRDMLSAAGYEVAGAPDGEKAIEAFTQALHAGVPFDLVILDLTIPGGMGGKETLEHLRAIAPDIKAIVSSGYSNDPVMADSGKYGFSGVVAKPYKMQDLFAAVQRVMEKRQP